MREIWGNLREYFGIDHFQLLLILKYFKIICAVVVCNVVTVMMQNGGSCINKSLFTLQNGRWLGQN